MGEETGKKILIVDDESEIRDIMSILLEGQGYKVLTAADGEKAIEAARSKRPDLIIMDNIMPKMTGIQAFNTMKTDPRLAGIPVIMLTASVKKSGESDEYWRESIGVNDFISKPFEPEDILGKVEKLLG